MIPMMVNVAMTNPGVRIGLQAGSSCCVNLEYTGFLECFLLEDLEVEPPPAAELVVAPLVSISYEIVCCGKVDFLEY